MAKKERVNKHPDWRLSRSEKNWYYVGDTARLFCIQPLPRRISSGI